jgi:hypothetical protein
MKIRVVYLITIGLILAMAVPLYSIQITVFTYPYSYFNIKFYSEGYQYNGTGFSNCVMMGYSKININSVTIFDNGSVSPSVIGLIKQQIGLPVFILNYSVGLWYEHRWDTSHVLTFWDWEFHEEMVQVNV